VLSQFTSHIQKKALFKMEDKLLVAVSGGIDSMILCDLLLKAGYKFSVAHCNFKLRGLESDGDEQFVKDYCSKNKLALYTRSFDTLTYAAEKKLSTQMAARELRYAFFNELMKEHSFNYLLTAHHLSDNVETFLINLIRGSGIAGLKGISEKSGSIIRPLLQFTKEEILTYSEENTITYRTDKSNLEDTYLRNDLRLNIIPKLKEINPSFERTISKELGLLKQYNVIIADHFAKEKLKAVSKTDSGIKIHIDKINESKTPELFLFEILKDYNFHPDVITDIYESLDGIPGKLFFSESYELVKDRNELVVSERSEIKIEPNVIEKETQEILSPIHLKIKPTTEFKKENSKAIAYIDHSKLKFPLTIRGWQNGDKFKPLGMTGFKKLSDLFVDLKLNAFEKNKVAIIENGDKEIIWVVNHRLDDRYKISDNTNNILRIELVE
jgi:tRNA(Ile)-lysidine synthase